MIKPSLAMSVLVVWPFPCVVWTPKLGEAFLRGSQCLGRAAPSLRSSISYGSAGWTRISLPVGAVLLHECGRGQLSSRRKSYRSLSCPDLMTTQILLLQLSNGLAEPGLFPLVLLGILRQVPSLD